MGKNRTLFLRTEQRELLEHILESDAPLDVKTRCRVLLLLDDGHTYKETAEIVGRSTGIVNATVSRLREYGVLVAVYTLNHKRYGVRLETIARRPKKLHASHDQLIRLLVARGAPDGQPWSLRKLARAVVEASPDIDSLSSTAIMYALKRMGISWRQQSD